MTSLAELFPEGDFRFHLTVRRGEPRDFFAAQDPSGKMLAERAKWLEQEPARHRVLQPEGEALVDEFAGECARWGILRAANGADAALLELGTRLEPDLLFLAADDRGRFRLRAGALCFPSGWALEEKIGRDMDFIHGVVPGLNAALASPIQQFLSKLKPGMAFLRDNWGLAATDELNLHPARGVPPPMPPVSLARLWLRVEYQALMALPRTKGIVFGIRIALHRLDRIVGSDAAAGLARALETMPPEVAAYKRLDGIRGEVIRLLRTP